MTNFEKKNLKKEFQKIRKNNGILIIRITKHPQKLGAFVSSTSKQFLNQIYTYIHIMLDRVFAERVKIIKESKQSLWNVEFAVLHISAK